MRGTGLHCGFRAHLEACFPPCVPGFGKEDPPDTETSFPLQPLAQELLFSSVHSFPVPAAPWDRPDVTALVDGTGQSQALKPASSKDLNARADLDVSCGMRAGRGSLRVSVLRAGRRSEADE